MSERAHAGRIFTFDTTHHALWAEEVAREEGIPAEVIPAPPAAQARCNLALETLPEDVETLAAVFVVREVPFRLHPPTGNDNDTDLFHAEV